MLRNYLEIAFRNLLRQRGYSVINIAGLAVGLAAFLFIALWIQDELSYDRSHEKADRIYRVVRSNDNGVASFARPPPLLAPTLRNNFPEVEQAIRIKRAGTVIRHGRNHFQEDHFFYGATEFTTPTCCYVMNIRPVNLNTNVRSLMCMRTMAPKHNCLSICNH